MDEQNKPSNNGSSKKLSDKSRIPGIMTRDEYERIGDDPEPLPQGFEIISGTGGTPAQKPAQTQSSGAPSSISSEILPEDEEPSPAESAFSSVSDFFSQGAQALKSFAAAKRAVDEAQAAYAEAHDNHQAHIQELEHRRDIIKRFDSIVQEQNARQVAAEGELNAAQAQRQQVDTDIATLKDELKQMKDADTQTEKRLKSAVDAAEAKEASARESGTRLQRRLDDARRNLTKVEEERISGIAAAEHAIETARIRLQTLREAFAEVQRNPSANTAAYSVRTSELQNDIIEAVEELRLAEEALPHIEADLKEQLTTAHALVQDAEAPINSAKQAFQALTVEADSARDTLDKAKQDAQNRQRELRERISEQEKTARELAHVIAEATDELDDARAQLSEASDIKAHPERLAELASLIQQEDALLTKQAAELAQLEAHANHVREQTRDSRLKFIATLAGGAILIVILLVLWFIFLR
ncbi:hypothetical protein KPC83_05270 [Collinsella sp. zg1085]|uniref:hypothetical protein n=1 Tax=Collinsella sp. zg1085 TaxID=2844380 RepID=UPI001C0C984A|nr:hypothetical protein [Collinsella sp. zg1085]QWT17253.1 hypothetical protein KPC83_05270 [Collinsella sp. zg1085]